MITNVRISAGRAKARLGQELIGLIVIAPTGYLKQTAQERIGTVKQLRSFRNPVEVAFLFQWADEKGTAEIAVFKDEDITLCLSPEQKHLLQKLDA